MPTKVSSIHRISVLERVIAFSKTIEDGVGWSIPELSQEMNASATQLKVALLKHGIKGRGKSGYQWFLVNEKTRKQFYANKT